MTLGEPDPAVLTLAVAVFFAGLILIAASAGEALNFRIQIDPDRKGNALVGGVLAMAFGTILGFAAFLDPSPPPDTSTAIDTATGAGPTTTTASSPTATPGTSPTATPGTSPTATPGTSPPVPTSSTTSSTATQPTTAVVGCRITIENPLATLSEEPDVFSQEVTRVPAGVYDVEEVTTVTFGSQRQRWFRMTASGRSGWLEDTTFNISEKSPECP